MVRSVLCRTPSGDRRNQYYRILQNIQWTTSASFLATMFRNKTPCLWYHWKVYLLKSEEIRCRPLKIIGVQNSTV